MNTINGKVKSFKTLRFVKSFFYLLIALLLTNYIINYYLIWYFNNTELFIISSFLFLILYFLLKKILVLLRFYNFFIIIFLFLVLLIKTFIIDIKRINGNSMEPSLKNGQFVIIDKIHYGINIPYFLFPIGVVGYKKYCPEFYCKLNQLKRYDLVVFDFPDPIMKKRIWLKRIIGLEKEEYEFKNQNLYINQKKIDFYPSIEFLPEYHPTPIFVLPEELKKYPIFYQYYFLNGSGKKNTIPSDSFLMLGDNTKLSRDSRIYGFIPKERIVGKVIYEF